MYWDMLWCNKIYCDILHSLQYIVISICCGHHQTLALKQSLILWTIHCDICAILHSCDILRYIAVYFTIVKHSPWNNRIYWTIHCNVLGYIVIYWNILWYFAFIAIYCDILWFQYVVATVKHSPWNNYFYRSIHWSFL